ncbi:potassium-transporting ATPase subunit C [Streptomyces sp. NPDC059152]|uniref:potassium-transporting ATPase subunit C n=1 Tax=unclassified Streptomyces TaxID=2593676 RepID=UPI0033D80C03
MPNVAVAGSRVEQDGKTVGSSLLGQNFNLPKKNSDDPKEAAKPDPEWFQPRPSLAGDGGYDPTSSSASNLGPNSDDLVQSVKDRRAAAATFDKVAPKDVPADAVTASGSGLDPDISPAYAYEQVERVAKARGLSAAVVRRLVAQHVQDRVLGFLGEPRVNVIELNLALARLRRGDGDTRRADRSLANPRTTGRRGIRSGRARLRGRPQTAVMERWPPPHTGHPGPHEVRQGTQPPPGRPDTLSPMESSTNRRARRMG